MPFEPKEISYAEYIDMIENEGVLRRFLPLGLFYTHSRKGYIGIDNSDGSAETEIFKSKDNCVSWLTNKGR